MADGTAIEWTDATWNPITGCSVVSPGCTNCYAMKLAGTRLKNTESRKGLTVASKAGPVWNGQVRLNEQWLDQPLRWTRPRRIFVCAHGDLFAENVPDEWIDRVFAVMALAPHHTFQVLTKRAARMRQYVYGLPNRDDVVGKAATHIWGGRNPDEVFEEAMRAVRMPLPNVWLGVSTEDQARANERIPDLLATPAAVRFVSAEPLLGPIDFERIKLPGIINPFDALRGDTWGEAPRTKERIYAGGSGKALDWIIVGGESGKAARPMHPDWVMSIRDQCDAAGVAFFFKQWGAWGPFFDLEKPVAPLAFLDIDGNSKRDPTKADLERCIAQMNASHDGWELMANVGKKRAGRMLDGFEHSAFPDLPEVPFR